MIIDESILITEILWSFEVVKSHLPFRSCIDLSKLFLCVFPDSEIARKFTISKTKCAYLMNYIITPHFKSILLISIQNSPFYSLSLGEWIQSCKFVEWT